MTTTQTTTGFFKVETLDEAYEASLAEFVKTIEVNQVELRSEKSEKQLKKIKIRKAPSIDFWDCLNK